MLVNYSCSVMAEIYTYHPPKLYNIEGLQARPTQARTYNWSEMLQPSVGS